MSTKTITGAYSGGYYLNPTYDTLDISASASVGGNGVRASSSQASTIDNYGTIAPTGSGVVLLDGGSLINGASGKIGGGVSISGQAGTIVNTGSIIGASYTITNAGSTITHQKGSVILAAGGSLTNAATGVLTNGVSVTNGSGTVANYGVIGDSFTKTVTGGQTLTTTYASVMLADGGTVVNGSATNATATLQNGVSMGGGTITNFGVIGANSAGVAVAFAARLIEEASGVITGAVNGGGGVLELGGAAGAGTISGLGGAITGFSQVQADAGASWTFNGANTIASGEYLSGQGSLFDSGALVNDGSIKFASTLQLSKNAQLTNAAGANISLYGASGVTLAAGATGASLINAGVIDRTGGAGSSGITAAIANTGTIIAGSGLLDISGGVTGSGAWDVGAGARLEFDGSVAAGGTVSFTGFNGVLLLDDAKAFSGSVAGFAGSVSAENEAVDLGSLTYGSGVKLAWSAGTNSGTLTVTSGAQSAAITFLGRYSLGNFVASKDSGTGTDITFVPTTKTITGGYASGYALAPAYDAVTVASSGSIGGTGLVTQGVGSASVDNLGTISGVDLAQGGILQNGSSTNTVASIGTVDMGNGILVNDGRIIGASSSASNDYYRRNYLSVGPAVLFSGQLHNNGSIGQSSYKLSVIHQYDNESYLVIGVGVASYNGGTVTNGSESDTSASIGGISLSGGVGTITNFGKILYASEYTVGTSLNTYYSFQTGYYWLTTTGTSNKDQYSVALKNGGAVTNGSPTDEKADIAAGILVEGGQGTVVNFGEIGGPSTSSSFERRGVVTRSSSVGYSVVLNDGGAITNGGSSDAGAALLNGVSISGGGTITNFGSIGSGNAAVMMSGTGSLLIEEGSGVLNGAVNGGGGVLELAPDAGTGTITGLGASITNFATVSAEAGATWHFSKDTIASGVRLTNVADIVDDDLLTNDGVISLGGNLELATNAELDNVANGALLLAGAVAVVAASGATGASLYNAGLIQRAAGAGASGLNISVDNMGTIADLGGGLNVYGPVTGSGVWNIGAGAELQFGAAVAAGGEVAFNGANGILLLTAPKAFAGEVVGFGNGGETIDLRSNPDGPGVGLYWSGTATSGELTVGDGVGFDNIAFVGHYAPASFHATLDGAGGTDITFVSAVRTISSSDSNFYYMPAGHYLRITSTGSMNDGLDIAANSTLVNNGLVVGGLGVIGGATVVNGGSITGAAVGHSGVYIVGADTLINTGAITGGGTKSVGVGVSSGAMISNEAGATIYGFIGVRGQDVTITNFGSIGGARDSVAFLGRPSRLIEEASGVLTGKVVGGGGTLELGTAAGAGTITGLGTAFTGFSNIIVDAGAGWHFAGANRLLAGQTLTTASAIQIDDNGTMTSAGVIDLGALAHLGTNAELYNQAGGQIMIGADVAIGPLTGATGARLINAGLLEKTAGTGLTKISADLSGAGAITALTGTIDIAGLINSIAGSVSGSGMIEFGAGATTLLKGASLTVTSVELVGAGTTLTAAETIAYARTFTASANTVLAINTGDTFTLNGAITLAGDIIDGDGHLATTHTAKVSAVTLGGKAEWLNSGVVSATGVLTIGDAAGDKAEFINQTAGVFNMTGAGAVGAGTSASDTFENDGLLERTGVTGSSVIAAKLVNTGTIVVSTNAGLLDITGAVSGAGATQIKAGATLEFASSVTAGGTVDLAGTKAVLLLADAAAFRAQVEGFGSGRTIDLRGGGFAPGATLSYAGTTTSGTLTVKDGTSIARIDLLGQYAAANFKTSSDGASGLDITFVAVPSPALATPSSGH